ncbi:MAG: hypothetical protein LBI74_09545 [Synergistaceae bacterium]|jgi:hypothetical protein|nr:hypothetical protein [Synergistaceae bacterium]
MIKGKDLTILVLLTLIALLSTLAHPSAASVSDVEEIIEAGMKEALSSVGLSGLETERIARQYLFIGSVMIKNAPISSLEEEEELLRQSENTGRALGAALGITSMLYGGSRLDETATVMMHSVRAGVSPDIASKTYSVLATSGYAFEAATSLLHEVSEAVRVMRLDDGGDSVCGAIRAKALENAPLSSLKMEITTAMERERERELAILARNEKERRKHDGSGESGRAASSQGGGGGGMGSPGGGGDVGKAGGENSSGGQDGASGAGEN